MANASRHGWLAALAALYALSSLGGNCSSSSSTSDGGSGDGGVSSSSGEAGGPVAATCQGVCACLGSACADYPFQPDCVTACMDPTNNPPWDLACRATECRAAETDHDTHCPNASGQTKCH